MGERMIFLWLKSYIRRVGFLSISNNKKHFHTEPGKKYIYIRIQFQFFFYLLCHYNGGTYKYIPRVLEKRERVFYPLELTSFRLYLKSYITFNVVCRTNKKIIYILAFSVRPTYSHTSTHAIIYIRTNIHRQQKHPSGGVYMYVRYTSSIFQ